MPDHSEIYKNHIRNYEDLISREDYKHNLLPALMEITQLKGMDIIELGAGTGRLTVLLAPVVRSIKAYDASKEMISAAKEKLKKTGLNNWYVDMADSRNLPAEDNSAHIVISAWSLSYIVQWNWNNWREELNIAFKEIKRILRPGGTIILIETLGTGYENPEIKDEKLKAYYSYLEEEKKFKRKNIRTDYLFETIEEGDGIFRFFFGNGLTDYIIKGGRYTIENNKIIIPECTGIWWNSL